MKIGVKLKTNKQKTLFENYIRERLFAKNVAKFIKRSRCIVFQGNVKFSLK